VKVIFIAILLTICLHTLIIALDVIMGIDRAGIIRRITKPFGVMERSEYTIICLFILSFLTQTLKRYWKMKKEKQTSPEQG